MKTYQYPITVSVILAVYNSAAYLRECLESIINQTYRNLEIICINDGSTDSSLEILKEYRERDERIRIFSKENEGLGGASARNLGLEIAGGYYVLILDSDDFFEPQMIEEALQKAQREEADIVLFGGYEFDAKKNKDFEAASILNEKILPKKECFSYRDIPDYIYQLSQGMAWNKLFRRGFLKKHDIQFQRIRYTDDAYFTFAHMVLAERIAVVKKNFVHYRVNSGTNQTSGLKDYPDSAFLPYIQLKSSLEKWEIYPKVKKSFINCSAAFLRYCYDMVGSYEAFEYLHDKYAKEIFMKLDISESDEGFSMINARIYGQGRCFPIAQGKWPF